jgi:hypothetical protein
MRTSISFLTKADMVGFREARTAKLSATSARLVFSGGRMIFRAARINGILRFDPMETVKPTKKTCHGAENSTAFTVEEIHQILFGVRRRVARAGDLRPAHRCGASG